MPAQDIRILLTSPRAPVVASPITSPARRRNRVVESDSSDQVQTNGAAAGQVIAVTSSESDDMYVYPPIQPAQPEAPPPQNVTRRPDVNPVRSPQQSASARQPVQQRQSVQPPMPQPRSRTQTPKRRRPIAAEAEESAGHTSEFSCDESGESAREQYRSSILGVRSRPAALHQVSHHRKTTETFELQQSMLDL
jgi:flagellar basal body rod protein FlgC